MTEFAAARTFFEKGDCAGARPHFLASLRAEQSVGARFNLAECAARGGRPAEAWNHFRAAERLAIGRGESDRAKLAHDAASDLEPGITILRVSLPPGEVALTVDGTPVDVTDHWLLASGYAVTPEVDHVIVADAPGMPRWERRGVHGAAGAEIPMLVVERTLAVESPRPASERRASPLRTTAFVIGGTGIASLATGGVFTLLASAATSDAKGACATGDAYSYPGACDPLRRDDVTSFNHAAQTDAAVATVTVIGGAALLSGAALLYLLSHR